MSRLDELIRELCPDGVVHLPLGKVCDVDKGVQFNKTDMQETGSYPVINGGINPSGYIEQYNQAENTITISQGGASAGYVNWLHVKFWAGAHCYVLKPKDCIENRYLYHFVKANERKLQECQYGAGIPALGKATVIDLSIPVPPLPVQREIVRILDNFTELTAELTARQKQYEYYRDLLLSKDEGNNTIKQSIGTLSKYRRGSFPQPYGNAEWYDGEGSMPFVQVADIGNDMRLVERTKRKISVIAQPKSVFAPKGSIIISLQGSIGRIAVTQYDAYIDRTVAIFNEISPLLNKKYFVYQLQRIFSIKEKTARGSTIKTITKEEFTEFPIPVPHINEQNRIVSILDKLYSLSNDISIGLPAEIAARQKQYEYYRDKLLTFKEKTTA